MLMPVAPSDEKQGQEKGKGELKDRKYIRPQLAPMDMVECLGAASLSCCLTLLFTGCVLGIQPPSFWMGLLDRGSRVLKPNDSFGPTLLV